MNTLNNKTALVTGGSRGIGRGIVEALAAQSVQVWALARNTERLAALKREVKGVQTLTADATHEQVAAQALRDIHPDILVLNAGVVGALAPVYEQSWEEFNRVWESDMKATFNFGREALRMPLKPGSVVVVISSAAAYGGGVLSGSYAAAKRGQWILPQHLQQEANNLKLGIRFAVLVPRQMVGETELGHTAAIAYSARQGITKEQYLERMGPTLTPAGIGESVVSLLTEDAFQDGLAFSLNGQELTAIN